MIQPLPTGAAVQFPKDRALIDRFKVRFPKARWGAGTKSWHIPGKLAVTRVEKWAAAEAPYLRAIEQALRDLEWDGIETDPLKALESRRAEVKSRNITIAGGELRYEFRYLEASVDIARSLPGARWRAPYWTFRPGCLADVDTIVDGCNRIFALNIAAQEQ